MITDPSKIQHGVRSKNIVTKRQTKTRRQTHYRQSQCKIVSHRQASKQYIQMATKQELSIELIVQIAMMAAKTAVETILEERTDDDFSFKHRGETRGVRHRHNGHSSSYTYAEKVKNSIHIQKIYKAEAKDISEAKNVRDRQNIIQEENEDNNQTVKSLKFC